jgi:hypothetical protein
MKEFIILKNSFSLFSNVLNDFLKMHLFFYFIFTEYYSCSSVNKTVFFPDSQKSKSSFST